MTVASLAASEHFQNYCLNPTEETTQYWENWLVQHPENLEIFEEAKALVLSLAIEPSESDIQVAFKDFKAAVEKRQHKEEAKLIAISNQPKPKNNKGRFIAIAATIALLLTIGFWQYLLPTNDTVLLTTNFGEVKTHLLPDGEAFFEVIKKSDKKQFIVQTDKGIIQVLGTSFNVKQRATAFEVALLEGVVALSIPKYPKIKMSPGELVRVDGTNFYDRSTADVDAFSAWRFQRMVFKESTIAKVIQRLQDEFDWTVNVADQALLKRKITATIPKNDPELLLEALSEIYDLKIEQVDKKAYLIK